MLWLLGTFTLANFAFAPLGVFFPLLVKFNLAADWSATRVDPGIRAGAAFPPSPAWAGYWGG